MPRNDSLDDDFDFRTEDTESDVSLMKRVYKNEVVRAFYVVRTIQIAPEILDYKLELISNLKERISIFVGILVLNNKKEKERDREPTDDIDSSFKMMLYEVEQHLSFRPRWMSNVSDT